MCIRDSCDIKQEWADGGKEKIKKGYARLVEKGKMTQEAVDGILAKITPGLKAVSYTHLDVYKRQVSTCQGSFCGAICRRRNLLRSAARDSVSVQGSRNITCLLYTSRCV